MSFVRELLALCLAACWGRAQDQHHLFTFSGLVAGDAAGRSVAGVGDLDGDGRADVAVACPLSDAGGTDAGLVLVFSGRDGALLHRWTGSAGDELGTSVAAAGDADGDGVPDVVAGAPRASGSGQAVVYSGKTGSVLRVLRGNAVDDRFGQAVSGVGDANGDSYADVVVGAPGVRANGVASGRARVFSGKDGQVLWTVTGPAAGDNLGNAVAAAGDVDKDGRADVLIGAFLNDTAAVDAGRAGVFSGKDGSLLFAFDGEAAGDRFGVSLSGGGDADKDGWPDFVIGAYLADDGGRDAGHARVFSGRDGRLLLRLRGAPIGAELGSSVAVAGDVDGDGHEDILVGSRREAANGREAGATRLYSGRDGGLTLLFLGEAAGDWLGASVAAAGDVDGDRVPDLLAGAPQADAPAVDSGLARVWSGRRLALAADRHELSLGQGGAQSWSLDAGPARAGGFYLVLGSMSGTSPGIDLFHSRLPLNSDAYLQLTLSFPNSLLLPGSFGRLDAHGWARARFVALPQLPAALAGRVLHHAFVVTRRLPYELSSNAVPLRLVR